MKNRIGLILMGIGVLLLIIAGADAIGIVVRILEKLCSTSLRAPFFSSFLFRVGIMVIAGVVLLIGGTLYHQEDS